MGIIAVIYYEKASEKQGKASTPHNTTIVIAVTLDIGVKYDPRKRDQKANRPIDGVCFWQLSVFFGVFVFGLVG